MLMTSRRPKPRSGGFELWSWFFMRVSGVVLLALVLIHLAIVHVFTPIQNVDFQFVANRWAGTFGPLWRWFDLIMLGLGLGHGLNGARVVLDDYVHSPAWRTAVAILLWSAVVLFLVVGSQVIVSFAAK